MSHVPVKLKKLRSNAVDLRRGSSIAAGVDVAVIANYDDEFDSLLIQPGEVVKIPTGWAFELPNDVAMLILPRSSTATKKGLRPVNTPGLLDPDYRGELFVAIENVSGAPQYLDQGEYFAQIMFVPYITPMFQHTQILSDTDRGEGGFGSSDTTKS